jgi:predicted DsbA family dithiol-disulfide isomerase
VTVIEVFADVTCPFTHVGLRRWAARRVELGRRDVRLRVRAWPLELVNGVPLDADSVAHKIDDLRATVAPELFDGFDPTTFPTTTLPALRLTHAAYELTPEAGESVAFELRTLLFEHGVDVSRPDVLDRLAARHGVHVGGAAGAGEGPDPVVADLEEGRRRGVIGSPHFFGPGFDVFCPGLRIEPAGGHLAIAEGGARFADFVDRCFRPSAA